MPTALRPGEPSPADPLDDLTAAEIAAAVVAARSAGGLPAASRIVSVTLEEPGRDGGQDADAPGRDRRRAAIVAVDPRRHVPLEITVDVGTGAVLRQRAVDGAHAPVTLAEYARCERLVRADERFQAGLRRRGIETPEQVLVEAWGIGDFDGSDADPRRLVWTLAFYRAQPDDNPYAKPVTGLHAIVDLDAEVVVRVEDSGPVGLPPGRGAYSRQQLDGLRTDLRPLEIHQPQGPSFTLDGRWVRWQRWSFHIGFNAREGMVLHRIGYQDQGRVRSIVERASVAELVIPYADPRRFEGWRNAFDIGEYGIGIMTNSLELGCDCLGEIRYLDVTLADVAGSPYTIPHAICLHEEDSGLLWKHHDATLGSTEVRRSRRMVVSFIITAGNYEYAFYWYFYQDGTLECEVRLTGIVLTSAIEDGATVPYGTVVAARTLAAHHQHFFCFRLDMAVDGPRNRVEEVDTVAMPEGPGNPYGNGFMLRRTALATEQMARRRVDPLAQRHWLVTNPEVTNRLGQPVGYKLAPQANAVPFADPQSSVRRRARFMDHHLWVTPYDPTERFPAGDYPNQTSRDAGLPAWTAADRPLEGRPLVLWYTLGSHHIPRPEDWPVMPVERVGFALKPVGFFDQSPAVDVAP